jgi:F-type H+-transporting ATPase subunit epsilon
MSEKTFLLEIVTPEKKLYSDKVNFAVFPGSEGELGILFDHAPLLSRLLPGEIRIAKGDTVLSLAISGGFLDVRKNEVSVISETAETADQIDKGRALAEKESAEAEIKKALASSPEYKAANLRLKKAEARLKVVDKAASVSHKEL